MHKTVEFLELYERNFAKKADEKHRLLEIGVQHGGSVEHWKKQYPKWDVVGLDIDPSCAGGGVVIGDQTNVELLSSLGAFDIVIDDGGHTMHQQQTSFKELFPKLRKGGIYVIEDLHTSFWPKFWDQETKTIDFLTSLVPAINTEANNARLEGNVMPENKYDIHSVCFYPSIAFIWKN